ncbi:Protein phosphatase [Carpediemonas membranifera]|uniref:Protein phosphatase n=1 Tax=Carpediemonas membranifera TaxID=201153 RepID=A0A8J6AX44_9EUKA|nr:Protein phosphatase [Carpediemonas membranifera]|eukprot:KAG9397036.1 Protein phosphatase [Carpediemonas membranifera]
MFFDFFFRIRKNPTGKRNEAGSYAFIRHNDGRDFIVPISIACGMSSLQGRRPTMEDAHTVKLDLLQGIRSEESGPPDVSPLAFFGVYDGHCGTQASTHAAATLHRDLVLSPYFNEDVPRAFHDSFTRNDAEFLARAKRTKTMDGTTACCVLLRNDTLFAANAGDSRAVLGRAGEAVDLSYDHKPDRDCERARIEACGGVVHPTYVKISGQGPVLAIGPARVWPGGLALSRGLGDLMFKDPDLLLPNKVTEPLVSSVPEITRVKLVPGRDRFVIVACDGLWDVLSSQSAVSFVEEKLPAAIREARRTVLSQRHSTPYTMDSPEPGQPSFTASVVRVLKALFGIPTRPVAPAMSTNNLLSSSAPVDRVSTVGSDPERFADDDLTPVEMAQIEQAAATSVAQQLAQAGYTFGSTDNITVLVVLLRWPDCPSPTLTGANTVAVVEADMPAAFPHSTGDLLEAAHPLTDLDEIEVG